MECLGTVDRNVKWCTVFEKYYGVYSKIKIELNIESLYDLAILLLLGIWYKELLATPMFTAALFTIAKGWKHPQCPSTDEWIHKM